MNWKKVLPLLGLLATVSVTHAQETTPLVWASLDRALEEAATVRRPVLVYVQAAWCGPCRRMEHAVFPTVHPLLERLIRARLDYDDHETLLRIGPQARSPFDWVRHFGVEATPGFVLLAPDGTILARATGYLDARAFSLFLAYAVTGAYRYTSFQTYVEQTQPAAY